MGSIIWVTVSLPIQSSLENESRISRLLQLTTPSTQAQVVQIDGVDIVVVNSSSIRCNILSVNASQILLQHNSDVGTL
jgi:hypothetical protein